MMMMMMRTKLLINNRNAVIMMLLFLQLDLIGHNIINIIHEEDQQMMLNQLMPKSFLVGSNDEILFPDDMESKEKVAEALANERRSFNVR